MIIHEFKKQYSWKSTKTEKVNTVNEPMLEIKCDCCDKVHNRVKKHYNKMKLNPLFDKDYCNVCWQGIQNRSPNRRRKNSEAQIRRYQDPLEREKTRVTSKGNNAGDKNAMRRKEVRLKVSETRSRLMQDPDFRARFRQGSLNAWKRGAYTVTNDANCRCKWHTYKHSNGTEYRVQGTWELKFIQWMDENNLRFECHKGRLDYIDDHGIVRSYYPDFFVYDWNSYVDPKADHWYKKQYRKFELLKEQHPDKNIQILTKQKLINLGIQI